MNINQFTDFWLQNIVMLECKKTTAKTYESIVDNHIKPFAGHIDLIQFDLKAAIEFRAKLTNKLKTSTVNKIINCLKIIFNKAIDLGYITDNPIKNLKFLPNTVCNISTLSANEITAFNVSNMPNKDIYLLALYTGLRLGEIAALRHCDVDLNSKLITVSRTKTKYGFTSTKSNKVRKVPIHNKCVNMLANIIDGNSTGLIWNIDVSNFTSTRLKKDCIVLDVKPFKFHNFRHTFATNYIKSGGKITYLSKILGHSSVVITMDIYVSIEDNDLLTDINNMRY